MVIFNSELTPEEDRSNITCSVPVQDIFLLRQPADQKLSLNSFETHPMSFELLVNYVEKLMVADPISFVEKLMVADPISFVEKLMVADPISLFPD